MNTRQVVVGAVLILFVLVLINVSGSDDSPNTDDRPGASSLDKGRAGLSDLRSELDRAGHQTSQIDETPSRADLDPASTVVLLDSGAIDPQDVEALGRFVRSGGRLVFGGETGLSTYTDLTGSDINHENAGPTGATPILPAPETVDVNSIDLAGSGSFSDAGSTLPLLAGDGGEAVLSVATLGKGRLILLADASPLQNGLIGSADNAQLGLDLAGNTDRPVAFAERVRLPGETGLAALPSRWTLMFGGLLLAGLILIASRIRRTGPPEQPSREFAPPRRRYVDSVGAALAKVGDPLAAEPVRLAARRRLLIGSPAGVEAGSEELARAGAAMGLDPEEWVALDAPTTDEKQMLAVGSALAKLKETKR